MKTQLTQSAWEMLAIKTKRGCITEFTCPECGGKGWASRTKGNQLRARCNACGLVVKEDKQ